MKSCLLILPIFLFPSILFAQEKMESSDFAKERTDSSSKKNNYKLLPPRTLIIKMKDLNQIRNLKDKQFVVIDDTAHYTNEELASGLSQKELDAYRLNKELIKELITPPPPEESVYPEVSAIRKILGIAKTAAVILILILSLL